MSSIYENNAGTIKAYVETKDGFEFEVEAEYEAGDPGEKERFGKEGRTSWGSPANDSTCEIKRVFLTLGNYCEQNLDMTKLHGEISDWEQEIIDEIEEVE